MGRSSSSNGELISNFFCSNLLIINQAMRQAAQCAGRVIRNKSDYGIVVFADKRFARAKLRNKLPKWIAQFLTTEALDLDIGSTMAEVRAFLLDMAQPTDTKAMFEDPEIMEVETLSTVRSSSHRFG